MLNRHAPDYPQVNQCGPVYGLTKDQDGKEIVYVKHWRCSDNKSDNKWNLTNLQAKEAIMLCTDAASKTRIDNYIGELEQIVKDRCK